MKATELDSNTSSSVLYRSSQYFDNIGDSGFFLGTGANGTIQMNKTPYQGTPDAIWNCLLTGQYNKQGLHVMMGQVI